MICCALQFDMITLKEHEIIKTQEDIKSLYGQKGRTINIENHMKIERKQICGTWHHIFEEDEVRGKTFRQEPVSLKPSRGRYSFRLYENGKAEVRQPEPDDRIAVLQGTWEIKGTDKIIIRLVTRKEIHFTVVAQSIDRITIKDV